MKTLLVTALLLLMPAAATAQANLEPAEPDSAEMRADSLEERADAVVESARIDAGKMLRHGVLGSVVSAGVAFAFWEVDDEPKSLSQGEAVVLMGAVGFGWGVLWSYVDQRREAGEAGEQ